MQARRSSSSQRRSDGVAACTVILFVLSFWLTLAKAVPGALSGHGHGRVAGPSVGVYFAVDPGVFATRYFFTALTSYRMLHRESAQPRRVKQMLQLAELLRAQDWSMWPPTAVYVQVARGCRCPV